MIAMSSYRRALVVAAFVLTVLYLTTRSSSSSAFPTNSQSVPSLISQQYKDGFDLGSASTTAISLADGAVRPVGGGSARAGQKPMVDTSSMTLYDKLANNFPYDVEGKFPAYIWQTWKWTPADGEFMFREQEASWTELHPGFIHEVITDKVALYLLRLLYASTPEVIDAYEALPLPVLKADFFRYLILLARGGIYTDIDTQAIRSAIEWIPDHVPREAVGLVIGIEADPNRPDWADWYSRRIQFCQWTIQSKPGHPVLREAVRRITERTLAMKRGGVLGHFSSKSVIEFTGPALWTDIIFDYLNDGRFFDLDSSPGQVDFRNFTGMEDVRRVGDVLVLPITSFSPGVQQMGAKDYDDPMAFVKHDFEGTWKPESERHIGEQKQEQNQGGEANQQKK